MLNAKRARCHECAVRISYLQKHKHGFTVVHYAITYYLRAVEDYPLRLTKIIDSQPNSLRIDILMIGGRLSEDWNNY